MRSPPATMCSACRARSCTGPPTAARTRATSCSRPPASSSISCVFRWAACPRTGCGGKRHGSPCPWRRSRTARTSASCRTAAMPTSSRGCAPARWSRARSWTGPATCSAATRASSISPSASGAGWTSATPPAASGSMCWRWTRSAIGSSSGPAKRSDAGASGSARSTGSATARHLPRGSGRRSASGRAQPPGRRPSIRAQTGSKSCWTSRNTEIAAGQAAVFYERDRVLGGGWIVREAAA